MLPQSTDGVGPNHAPIVLNTMSSDDSKIMQILDLTGESFIISEPNSGFYQAKYWLSPWLSSVIQTTAWQICLCHLYTLDLDYTLHT